MTPPWKIKSGTDSDLYSLATLQLDADQMNVDTLLTCKHRPKMWLNPNRCHLAKNPHTSWQEQLKTRTIPKHRSVADRHDNKALNADRSYAYSLRSKYRVFGRINAGVIAQNNVHAGRAYCQVLRDAEPS